MSVDDFLKGDFMEGSSEVSSFILCYEMHVHRFILGWGLRRRERERIRRLRK